MKTIDEILLDIISDLDKVPDFPVEEICKKVAFVSTPRCGSTMFCDVLKKTGRVGNPMEWINLRYLNAYAKYFGIQDIGMDQYLDFILRKTTSSNGVFSINFHIEQHLEMLKHNFGIFTLGFDKSYYLYRKEKVDQAYSLARARISDQWTSDSKAVNEIQGDIGREGILQALMHISSSEEFYSANIKELVSGEYFYEDFSVLDSTNAYADVLSDLGITDYEASWATSMQKQRGAKDSSELVRLKEYLSPSALWHS